MRDTLAPWAVIACIVGCGGIAVIDREGSGGGGGEAPVTGGGGAGECSAPRDCPATTPPIATPCDCQGIECTYDNCTPIGSVDTYRCEGTWIYSAAGSCETSVCPNGLTCGPGEICVIEDSGFSVNYRCTLSLCAPPIPQTCACRGADEMCGEMFECVSVDPQAVRCECINC